MDGPSARLEHTGFLSLPHLAFQGVWDLLSGTEKLALLRTSHAVRKLASGTIKGIKLYITRAAAESKNNAKIKRLPPGTKLETITFCPKGKRKAGQGESDDQVFEQSFGSCLASAVAGCPWSNAHTVTVEALPVGLAVLPWLGLAVPNLRSLRLHSCTVDDLGLAGLQFCKNLTAVSLHNVTWRAANSVAKGIQVQSLSLLSKCPRLRVLRLEEMHVPHLEFLGRLSNLTHFTAKSCHLTMAGRRSVFNWEELFSALPKVPTLTFLNLEAKEHATLRPVENLLLADCTVACPHLTLKAAEALLAACPKLQHLHMGPRTPIAHDAFKYLLKQPQLNVLSASDIMGGPASPAQAAADPACRTSNALQHLILHKPSLESLAWVPLFVPCADLHLGTVATWSRETPTPFKMAADALNQYGVMRQQHQAHLLGGVQPVKLFLPHGSKYLTYLAPRELHLLCQPFPYRALCRQAVSAVTEQMQQDNLQAVNHEVGVLLNSLLPRLLVGLRDSMDSSGASAIARGHEVAQLQALAPLAGQLKHLHLEHFQIGAAHVEAVSVALHDSLEVLSIQHCSLHESTWQSMHQHLPSLHCLVLSDACKGKALTALSLGMFMAKMSPAFVVKMDSNLWGSDEEMKQLKEVLRHWPNAATLQLVAPTPKEDKPEPELPFEVRVTFQPIVPGGVLPNGQQVAAGAGAGGGAVVDIVVNAGAAAAAAADQQPGGGA